VLVEGSWPEVEGMLKSTRLRAAASIDPGGLAFIGDGLWGTEWLFWVDDDGSRSTSPVPVPVGGGEGVSCC